MADPALVDGGIITIATTALVHLARIVRDERERYKQKRNGGTPTDQFISEMRKLREATVASARLQARKLDRIHEKTDESLSVLKGGIRTQQIQSQTLQDIGLGISRLLGRHDGG